MPTDLEKRELTTESLLHGRQSQPFARTRNFSTWSWILTALSFAVFLFCFRETWLGMIHTWSSSRTFSHCFLIVPCALYLAWLRSHTFSCSLWQPTYKALPVFLVAASLWLVGNLADAKIIEQFCFVAMLIALIWAFFGSNVTKTLRFPLAFLFFAVPFGVSLIGPLQDFTAWFTVHTLNMTGIPAVLENRVLSVSSGNWTVSEACSGIRYLFASLVLGVFFGSLIYRSRKRRILLTLASILVPIVANGVRAYLIVILAYLTGNRIAVGVDHVIYGLVFFLVIQTALITLALRWRETDHTPVSRTIRRQYPDPATAAVVCAIVLVVSLIAPLWALQMRLAAAKSIVVADPDILVTSPWQPAPWRDASWNWNVGHASKTFVSAYDSGNNSVRMVYALFLGDHTATIENSYELFSHPASWALAHDKFETATIDGQDVLVHKSVFVGPVMRTVWTWYWIDGEYTGSTVRMKWLQAKSRLLGRPTMVIAISVGSDGVLTDPGVANRVLQDFVAHTTFTSPTTLTGLLKQSRG